MPPTIVSIRNRKLKGMPWGEPGCGKTRWSCGAQDHPDMSPVLVIDSDDGLLSVAARGDIAAERVRTLDEYETLLGRIAVGDPVYKEFKTLITDSGSDLLDKALRETSAYEFERQSEGKGRAKRSSKDELHQKDYGKVTAQMKRLFDQARNLPMHSIITSLAATHYPVIGKDQSGNDVIGPDPDSVHPAFTAKLGINVRGLMDFVWYFYRTTPKADSQERVEFKYLTQERGPYKCKTRGDHFPDAIGVTSQLSLPEVYDLLLRTEVKA
jgi:hypothetical protein